MGYLVESRAQNLNVVLFFVEVDCPRIEISVAPRLGEALPANGYRLIHAHPHIAITAYLVAGIYETGLVLSTAAVAETREPPTLAHERFRGEPAESGVHPDRLKGL